MGRRYRYGWREWSRGAEGLRHEGVYGDINPVVTSELDASRIFKKTLVKNFTFRQRVPRLAVLAGFVEGDARLPVRVIFRCIWSGLS